MARQPPRGRRHARRADRLDARRRAAQAGPRAAPGDPHERHDRHAQGRRSRRAGLALTGRRAARARCRSAPATSLRSRRRCSTRSASRRACCRSGSARRSCCSAASRRPRRSTASPGNRVTTWVIVPVMLQRVLALDPEQWADRDLSRAADHLPERLAARHRPGPRRARAASVRCSTTSTARLRSRTRRSRPRPTSRPSPRASASVVRGAVVKILGADGEELPTGQTGRIFVGHMIEFEGYTGGGDKERIRGHGLIRGCRPLRRRGSPVHRRPRRRDDHLRRGERVPARDRGAPALAPGGARGGGRRRSGRAVRPAAERVRGAARRVPS